MIYRGLCPLLDPEAINPHDFVSSMMPSGKCLFVFCSVFLVSPCDNIGSNHLSFNYLKVEFPYFTYWKVALSLTKVNVPNTFNCFLLYLVFRFPGHVVTILSLTIFIFIPQHKLY